MIEFRIWLGIARGGSNTYWLRRRWLTAAIELTPSDSCLVLLAVEVTRSGFGDGDDEYDGDMVQGIFTRSRKILYTMDEGVSTDPIR